MAGILKSEHGQVIPDIMIGPRDLPTREGGLCNGGSGVTSDGKYWIMYAGNQATPTVSYYI